MLIKKLTSRLFSNEYSKIESKIYLSDYLKRFNFISCSLYKDNVEIISSDDDIGGYIGKKILLPSSVSISNIKNINIYIYIYKIIFSTISRKLGFYLPKKNYNIDYLLLNTLLTIRSIHKLSFNEFEKLNLISRILYSNIDLTRISINKLEGRDLLLEIIFKKMIFKIIKTKISLTNKEKVFIYNMENVHVFNQDELFFYSDKFYNQLCTLYKNYKNITLNLLWGYLYFNSESLSINSNNKNEDNFTRENNEITKKFNRKIELVDIKKKENNYSHINLLFDYKNISRESNKEESYTDSYDQNLNISNDMDIKSLVRDKSKVSSIYKSEIYGINNEIENLESTNDLFEHQYDEWNYKKNKYNKTWCSVYTEKLSCKKEGYENILLDILKRRKNEINKFKNNLKVIFNVNLWKNRQLNGHYIDFDSCIDNYISIKKNLPEKYYKYKIKKIDNVSMIILLDLSLSTDGFINNNKILDFIKEVAASICYGIDDVINNYLISAFYSNTRYDCKYFIIKSFKEKWKNKKETLFSINSNGYTRMGPAIRHSINLLNKLKSKKKIILLISDGKPTDYDEYEGKYGIEDVKKSILEANNQNIMVKGIIINNTIKPYFSIMFGKGNYNILNSNKKLYSIITKLLLNSIR